MKASRDPSPPVTGVRYFTKELWAGAQAPADSAVDDAQWDAAFRQYQEQFEALRPRVPPQVFDFFAKADVHDGELLDVRIVDGSRPAPLGKKPRRWRINTNFPVRVELKVLDAYDELVWDLSYCGVRRALIDYPSAEPLFYADGMGFSDWGYHELTDAGDGFLRHEVLFSSGSVLLFEFREMRVASRPRPAPQAGPGG